MERSRIHYITGLILLQFTAGTARSEEPPEAGTHAIFGIVMELRSGTPDVPVCLADAATGLPLARETYKPIDWGTAQPGNLAKMIAIDLTDDKGRFRFENVPKGK